MCGTGINVYTAAIKLPAFEICIWRVDLFNGSKLNVIWRVKVFFLFYLKSIKKLINRKKTNIYLCNKF